MRSALYHFLIIALALASFVVAYRLLRLPPPPTNKHIEVWRFEVWPQKDNVPPQKDNVPPQKVYVPPQNVYVPPPPNHESSRWSRKLVNAASSAKLSVSPLPA